MAQQFDIVGNLLLKVDGAEAGVNKLRNSLSKLTLPKNIDSGLKKSFSNLDELFARYKAQLKDGFQTKSDVTTFTKTAKAISAEYDKIGQKLNQLNNTNVTFNVKSDALKDAEKNLNKLLEAKNKLAKDTQTAIGKDLENLTKAGSRSTNAKDLANQLGVAINNGEMQKALELAERLRAKMVDLKSAKDSWSKMGTGTSLTDTLDKVITACQKGATGFDNLEKETKEAIQVLTNLQTGDLEKLSGVLDGLNGDWEKNTSAMRAASGEMQEYARSSQSMSQQLGDLQQSTQYFFSLRNMINLFKRGVDEAIQSVKELDAAMTETAVVTDYKVSDMWNMLPQYTQLANQLGATTQGAYETMTLYFQQGLDQQQAFELGAETMKMARIAGLDYAETTDMMTAALRGFNMELNETSAKRVNDVYSELAAITASDTEELGTAMQRTASIAHSAGSSFEGTTAFLAQAIETTREPAENIGTAMKTIIARFQEMKKNPLEISEVEGEEVDFNKIDAALKTIGVDLVDTNGQFRDFDKVMLEISQKWDTLSQSQQRYIATTAAGSRQQSRFIAMVSDYDRTMQLMEAANNSAGASDEQFGKTMDSLESKLNKLHNAWQQFTMGIANNGMIKFAVDGITKLLSGVNNLIDTFSLGSGTIKSFLSLFTAFTGLKASGKIMNSLIGGLGGMVDPTSTFSAGFGRGMTGNKVIGNAAFAAQINQPIVAGLKEVVGAINKETTIEQQQNARFADNSNAYAQRDAFKSASAALKDSFKESKIFSVNEIRKQLSGLTGENQSLLMRSNSSTFNAATNALLSQYAGKDTQRLKALKAGERNLNDARKAGQLTVEQYYQHLQDPGLLKDALLRSGIKQDNPAYQYLDALNNEITSQVATQTKTDIESAWRQHKLAQARYGKEYQTTDEDIQKVIDQEILSEEGQSRRRGQALKDRGLDPEFINTKGGKLLQGLGRLGGGISQAGMGIQAFGSILMSSANPALQTFGAALTSIGGLVSNLGMAIGGISSGFSAIAGSKLITNIAGTGTVFGGLMTAAGALTGGLMLLVGAIAGIVIAIKKHREKIKEDAEKVTTNYKEKNEKHQSNISNLESYREDFARLSAGVDSNGMNINLDTADYERYLEITRALADINPDIVDGYNAQGNAIISNKNALEDTLALEKERQAETFDTYISPDSTNTLLKARNLSRKARRDEADPYAEKGESHQGKLLGGYEFAPQADMRKQAKKIGQTLSKGVKEGWISEDALSDFDIKIDDLAKGTDDAVSAFEQNYDKVKARISSKMDSAGDELKDSTKESMLDAFSGYNEAADELDELITPLYEQTLAKVGKEIQVPAEFKSFFNQGIKDIVSDANITDIDGEIAKLTTSFSALGEEGSEYSKILEDVEIAQDKYAASLDANAYDEFVHGTNGAVERIQALKDELLDGVDTTQGYGKAVSEFLDNEINKIEDFTKAGAANLQQALNTMTSEIEAAEGVLENFNAITEGSTYGKAASNMSQIFETATAEEHALGEGDQVFWAGAEAIVGRENLLERGGANRDKALAQMEKMQKMLQGGEEGWNAFKDRWYDTVDNNLKVLEDGSRRLLDENGKVIEGLTLDENGGIQEIDDKLNPQVYEQIADALNMSKESLVAMLNLGRQFGEISFTNVGDVRKALATSESTIKNSNTGAVFVKQDALEAEMTSAGIDLNKQQEIEKDLQENYNTQLIKSADEITKTNNQFAEMGITSMESLVKTFDDTGQFTKDEIKEYAEKWAEFNGQEGELANFDKYWQNNQEDTEFGGIPSSLDSIESILSAIQSILASQRLSEGYLDNPTADTSKKWLFGGEGEDTAAQKFWKGHGSGANGEITTSEFNQTSKELTDFIAKGKDYIDQLDKVQPANETERKQIEAEKEAYEYQVSRAETYLKEGTEAYNTQVQSKIDAINQDKEVIDRGFADLLGSITPDQINTDAAQSTLNQLYEAAINNTPAILTDGLKAQMESLGIDIQKAIDAGLIVDENGILASAQKTGQDTAQAGVEGNISGQQEVDTTPAETAGEQKGKETGEAGVQGNANGQSSVVPPAVQHAEEHDNRGGNSQPEVAPKVDTSQIDEADEKVDNFKAKLSEGADFNINVTGVNDLDKAASAADKVVKNSGNKTVGVTTTFDSSAATAGIASLNAMSAKIKVGADTSAALTQAENVRKSIDKKSATINVNVKKTGVSAITVDGHTWNIATRAKGQNNHGYFAPPSFGSAAKGKYGQLGPKGKGGLTLTGELGYEVAWLPSENRSMILGADGPQMLHLPGDAIIWNHEQSKKILQQKAIPAGSEAYTKGKMSRSSSSSSSSSKSSGKGKSKKGKKSKKKKKDKKTPTINNFSMEEVVRFNINQELTRLTDQIARRTKDIEKALGKIGTSYSDILDSAQAQIGALNGIKEKNQALYNSYQAQLNDYLSRQAVISYTNSKGDSKQQTINISQFLNSDGSANTAAIQAAGGREVQEAIYKEISSAKTLVDGMNNAKKAIDDANDQIDEFHKKIADTFYNWENQITWVYDLTQRLNNIQSLRDRFSEHINLELDKVSTGFETTAQALNEISVAAKRDNKALLDQIAAQREMINARKMEMEDAYSWADEQKELSYQLGKNADQGIINQAETNLEAAKMMRNYIKSFQQREDGSIVYDIDWAQFEQDKRDTKITNTTYDAIYKQLEKLNSSTTEYNNSLKDLTSSVDQIYQNILEYQQTQIDLEADLLDGLEEQTEQDVSNLRDLGSSISDALQDLFDSVKRKLDERRQQEDNAKTERDISQKQQRLAALRANTAGGNQVEIAQLEKEIAESQQSYQRSLEDQLLDKLNQQADEAAKQRERQIDLLETANKIGIDNRELVRKWVENPQDYQTEITNVLKNKENFGEAGFLRQEQILREINKRIVEGQNASDQLRAEDDRTNTQAQLDAESTKQKELEAEKAAADEKLANAQSELTQAINEQTNNQNALNNINSSISSTQDRLNQLKSRPEYRQYQKAQAAYAKYQEEYKQNKQSKYDKYGRLNHNYEPQLTFEQFVRQRNYGGIGAHDLSNKWIYNTHQFKEIEQLEKTLDSLKNQKHDLTSQTASIQEAVKQAEESVKQLQDESNNWTQQIVQSQQTQKELQNKITAITTDSLLGVKDVADEQLNIKADTSYFNTNGAIVNGTDKLTPEIQAEKDYAITKQEKDKRDAAAEAERQRQIAEETERQRVAAAQQAAADYQTQLANVKAIKPSKVTKGDINALYDYGAAAGVSKSTVLSHLVGAAGEDPFTWVNILGPILESSGVNRWNLAATYGKGSAAEKAVFSHFGINTDKEKKKFYGDSRYKAFALGGLANYTGPAWLDGTPSKPELILNAKDTANFIALKDVLSKALGSTKSINNSYGGDNIFEININVDKIEKDYDVDRVADRVKKKILESSSYRNVTQVRNFR